MKGILFSFFLLNMNEAREPGKPLVGLFSTPAGSEINPPVGGTNLRKKIKTRVNTYIICEFKSVDYSNWLDATSW